MLINSPNISGSLTVTGNSVITGSLTVLGGINGAITGSATTASYVEYTNVANKPTLVSGSSQITYSGLTGIPSGIVSGSAQVVYSGLTGIPSGIISGSAQIADFGIFATTGSNQFNGNQAITGSLTTTGTIVAQTLNVQQVTSSVVFSSGSNVFGNSLANTQQFTGSMLVTGSLSVTTNGVELQVTNTGVNLGNALTDSHIISGSLRVNPNGLFVSGSGNVGIGTTSPQALFTVLGTNQSLGGAFNTYGNAFISTNNSPAINNGGSISFGARYWTGNTTLATFGRIHGKKEDATDGSTAGYLSFETTREDGAQLFERIRINSVGNVGIGIASPASRLNVAGAKTNSADLTTVSNQLAVTDTTATAAGVGGRISFLGAYTSTPDYFSFGTIEVLKDNANNYGSASWNNAAMRFIVGNNDNDANAGRMLERMRITSAGNVGIGATSVNTRLNVIKEDNGGGGIGRFEANNRTQYVEIGYQNINQWASVPSNAQLTFSVNDTERMRITSAGNVGIGTTSINEKFVVNAGTGARGGMALNGEYPYLKFNTVSSNANARNWAFSPTWAEFGDFVLARADAKDGDPLTSASTAILYFARGGAATFSSSVTANGNVRSIVTSPVCVGDAFSNIFRFDAFAQGGINQANSAVNLRVAFALTGGFGNEHCTYDLVASCSNGTWTIHVDSQTGRVSNNGGNFQVSAFSSGATLFIRSRKEFGGGCGYAQMNGMVNFAGCTFSTA